MSDCDQNRRQFLIGAGGFVTWAWQTRIAAAEPGRDPRLLVINLRGGMDGIGAVAPVADPDYRRVRADAVLSADDPARGLPLDGFFVLHPALKTLNRLYQKRDALILHAISTPYRKRSHFDAQDVLESGLGGAGHSRSGWLNRAMAALPFGEAVPSPQGLSIGARVPLLLRGKADVVSWMPPGFSPAGDDTRSRLLDLYRHTDTGLLRTFEGALTLDSLTGGEAAMAAQMGAIKGAEKAALMSASAIGRLLLDPEGPRLGAMELAGWDTHADGEPFDQRFVGQLSRLDAVLADLEKGLAPVWDQTVILVMTEFGRTARLNGSGTDHGVGTVALVIGGAVQGGKVLADWPGLSDAMLYDGRDLQATQDIRAVFKGVLQEHLGLGRKVLDTVVFPESDTLRPLEGLLQA